MYRIVSYKSYDIQVKELINNGYEPLSIGRAHLVFFVLKNRTLL